MQPIRFEREKMNNYMVMCCEGKLDRDSYGITILEFADIPELMNYEIREINGEQILYYRLKYRTSLKQVLGDLVLTNEKIHYMLCSIVEVIKKTEDYLLSVENILWKSDCTFIEVSSGKLVFTYCPQANQEQATLKSLLMEILQYVDKKNQQTYLYMMGFYNLVTNPDCRMEEIEEYVYKKNMQKEEYGGEQLLKDSLAIEREEKMELLDTENPQDKTKRSDKKGEYSLLSIVILSAVNFVVVCLLLFEVWTYQYIWVLIITLFLLFVAFLVRGSSEEDENVDKIMEEYWKESKEQEVNKSRERNRMRKEIDNTNFPSEITSDMETTLLTTPNQEIVVEDKSKELCLKATNPKKCKDVIIDKKSIVMGSMKDGCDYMLSEKGISRMHAKLMKKEDGLYLMDMNSTNGTFLNDQLVTSGKEYLLAEGDVISLAYLATFVVVERERTS